MVWFIVGLVLGLSGGYFVARQAKEQAGRVKEQLAGHVKEQLSKAVEAVLKKSQEQADRNQKAFLQLADENLGKHMTTAKREIDRGHQLIEGLMKPLSENYGQLNPQIESLTTQVHSLHSALSDNQQVGNWGEVQLRRVVEIAGMVKYCDFKEQQATKGGLMPDLVVNLPNGRVIVVDAKASAKAFLASREATDEKTAKEKEKEHARAMKRQVDALSKKNYGARVAGALDFVVMFVPGDPFLAAALRADDTLIDHGMQKKVAIATPASLIALLWTVNNAWQQDRVSREAQDILNIGKEMMESMKNLFEHYNVVGKRLDQAIRAYNDFASSYEHAVAPKGREFAKLVTGNEGAFLQANEVRRDSALPTQRAESDQVVDLTHVPARQAGDSQRSDQRDLFQ